LKVFFQEAVPEEDAVPGAVIAIQSFGDLLGFNSTSMFSPLMAVLMAKACSGLRLVLRQSNWRRSSPPRMGSSTGTKSLKCFFAKVRSLKIWSTCLCHGVIRASLSQERMTYFPEDSKVVYRSKDGKDEKIFDALEWIAAMYSHVPNKGEQMVRYYGHYGNVSRGKRKKQDQGGLIPSILEPDGSSKEYRRNWARLIRKIYNVNPLICPKCQGRMRILAFIEMRMSSKRFSNTWVCGQLRSGAHRRELTGHR
jgi:hypothetical protein